MSLTTRELNVSGGKVMVAEAGRGRPLLYLHGFADIHAASVGWLPFHEKLAESFRVIAPAHPACAGSDESEEVDDINDIHFHYLEVLDALGLDKVDIVGTCIGGWIAAELAVRNPDRVGRLVLIGASGLFVPGQPTGDLFWEIQAQNGVEYNGLRNLMFANERSPAGTKLFPDGRSDIEQGLSIFKAMRFASRVGFKPPYFYNRKLRSRLGRFNGPALLLWGEADRMVPRAHALAYQAGLGGNTRLKIMAASGHSPHVEQPVETVAQIRGFLAPAANKVAKKAPKRVAPKSTKKAVKKTVKNPVKKSAKKRRAR
jgi:pimeloyl-ACP methyl ester carboxylesterase